ncbi:hypothetical protein JCM17843_23410 [Kordiimonadales bacterium JCM 17843]|nr:hypothetical protein JCM17843_23410 [Kordiimonadales bacterium JCM 17843]
MTRVKTFFLSAAASLTLSLALAPALEAAPEAFVFDKAHTHIGLTWNHVASPKPAPALAILPVNWCWMKKIQKPRR